MCQASPPHQTSDVVSALKDVRWAPDKEMSVHVVSKSLAIWNKFGSCTEVQKIISTGLAFFCRKSLFEDWTKLAIIASSRSSIPQIVWIMESFIEAHLHKGKCEHTKEELSKKTSPINLFWLRRLAVYGLIEGYVLKAIETCTTLSVGKPSLSSVCTSLRKFKTMFESVQVYCQEKVKQENYVKGGEWRQELPAWCTVRLAKLLRQLIEGKRDNMFCQVCVVIHRKGGFPVSLLRPIW